MTSRTSNVSLTVGVPPIFKYKKCYRSTLFRLIVPLKSVRGLQICKRCPRSHFRVREVVDFADTVSKKMKNLRFITEANISIAFVLWCKHRNVELWFFLPLGRGEGSFAQPREGGRVHGRVYHSCYVSNGLETGPDTTPPQWPPAATSDVAR